MNQTENRTLVVIPTYNERENIAEITARVLRASPGVDVLVVDDNSPDGTGALASALASGHDRINVLHRAGKEGLGAAYRAGFTWGLERGYQRLVEMDADGSHQPEQLAVLLAALDTADVVLGSRWVAGGSVANWPLKRMLLSQAGSLYARVALGLPVRDITGGFRAFTAEALHRIGYQRVLSQGYCFQIDMLWKAYKSGLRIAEVPIDFVERTHGESKMSSRIVREAILRVTVWGLLALPARLRGDHRMARAAASAAPFVRDEVVRDEREEAGSRSPGTVGRPLSPDRVARERNRAA
ncbi:MAG: polyprenol monophosphomannose synthase [Actinomycetota bacterium]